MLSNGYENVKKTIIFGIKVKIYKNFRPTKNRFWPINNFPPKPNHQNIHVPIYGGNTLILLYKNR